MADNFEHQDTSMEEILGSIRKILSSDEDVKKTYPKKPVEPDATIELVEEVVEDSPSPTQPEKPRETPEPKPAKTARTFKESSPNPNDFGAATAQQDSQPWERTVPSAVSGATSDWEKEPKQPWEQQASSQGWHNQTPKQPWEQQYPVQEREIKEPKQPWEKSSQDFQASAMPAYPNQHPIKPNSRLVSQATMAASNAALSELTQHVKGQGQDDQGNFNTSIEDLLKSMLNPLLKDWLDKNLPTVIERVVREEIRAIVNNSSK